MMSESEKVSETETPERASKAELAPVLVENHRAFLSFLERRLGDRALAEDILQEAFVRSLDKAGAVRDQEALVPWFYRMLRNAVIDHQRRRASASRRLDAFAAELETQQAGTDTHGAVCACIAKLADNLKPQYADALRAIEIEGVAVKDYAERAGISASNAGVRIFRARDALRKQVQTSCGTCAAHGCLDCSCGQGG